MGGVALTPNAQKEPKEARCSVKPTEEGKGVRLKETSFALKVYMEEPTSAFFTGVVKGVLSLIAPLVLGVGLLTALNMVVEKDVRLEDATRVLKAVQISAKRTVVVRNVLGGAAVRANLLLRAN